MKWISLFLILFLNPTYLYATDLLFVTSTPEQLQLKAQHPNAPFIQKNHKTLVFNYSPESLKDLNTVEFELTDGFPVQAKLLNLKDAVTGGFVWLGRIIGDPTSYASFVVDKGQIVGEIYAGGHIYRLGYDEQQQPYMSQFAQKRNGQSGDDDTFSVPKPIKTKALVTTTSDDNFVDVILATTTEAAANSNAVATIEAMMAATNLMLADSCVNFRYRLLSVEATTYASGSNNHTAVLTALQAGTGALAALHTTRDALGADLVQIFVDSSSIGVCGLAYRADFGFFQENYGFGLVLYGCPAFTLAHELGHNLSLFHDRYQQDQDLTSTTSPGGEHYGYVDTVNGYESIMSYNDHCDENGVSCDRIGKFSNPRISHNGVPFGLNNFADNADALNRSFPFVANYRDSQTVYDPGISENCSAADQDKDIHCFIATATYGSYLHPKINILRTFRDTVLRQNLNGNIFTKLYYAISPKLVPYIKNSSTLRNISKFYIELIIFSISYAWVLLIFLAIILIKPARKLLPFLFILAFTPQSKAQYSISPFLESLAPTNSSLLLSGQSYFVFSPGFQIISSKAEPNGLTSIEESGNALNVYTAYTAQSFAFNLNYTPSWKKTIKSTTLPFSEVETTEEMSNLQVGFAFDFFDFLPALGISYSTETFLSKDNLEQDVLDKKRDSINIGSYIGFGIMRLGSGIIYSQESGTDASNSINLPDAKWISAYTGLAFDFSAASSMSEGSSFGKDGFQMEFSYLRDPEVIEINGASNIVLPATTTIGAFGQYAGFIGGSRHIFALEILSASKSSVDLFQPEATKTLEMTVSYGLQLSSWLISGNIYNQKVSGGFETSETGVFISIGYLSSMAGGDYNSTTF